MHERIAQHLMLFAAARTMHLEKRIHRLTVPVEPARENGGRCVESRQAFGGMAANVRQIVLGEESASGSTTLFVNATIRDARRSAASRRPRRPNRPQPHMAAPEPCLPDSRRRRHPQHNQVVRPRRPPDQGMELRADGLRLTEPNRVGRNPIAPRVTFEDELTMIRIELEKTRLGDAARQRPRQVDVAEDVDEYKLAAWSIAAGVDPPVGPLASTIFRNERRCHRAEMSAAEKLVDANPQRQHRHDQTSGQNGIDPLFLVQMDRIHHHHQQDETNREGACQNSDPKAKESNAAEPPAADMHRGRSGRNLLDHRHRVRMSFEVRVRRERLGGGSTHSGGHLAKQAGDGVNLLFIERHSQQPPGQLLEIRLGRQGQRPLAERHPKRTQAGRVEHGEKDRTRVAAIPPWLTKVDSSQNSTPVVSRSPRGS